MHVPDGFLNAATSVATGAVGLGGIAAGLRKAASDLDEKLAPMAGLVAAFIFALQMLNFPVAAGTSGHLLGGALAAILVGPGVGVLCIAIVLLVQALLFADGGLTALGTNLLLIGIVPAGTGWLVFRAMRRVLPANRRSVVIASAGASLLSVPVAAAAFALLFAVGGTVDLPMESVLAAMAGTHVLIGIGEALITAAVVSAVVGSRPDLVYGASDLASNRLLGAAEAGASP